MMKITRLEIDVKNEYELKNILSAASENVDTNATGTMRCNKCGNKHEFDRWIYYIVKSAVDEYVCDKCRKDG